MRKTKKTGDLRMVLLKTIDGVLDGSVDVVLAREVVNASRQINNNLSAEVDVARIALASGGKPCGIGELAIE